MDATGATIIIKFPILQEPEPITVTVGADMEPAFYAWIGDFFRGIGEPSRAILTTHNGSIVLLGVDEAGATVAVETLDFSSALLSQVTLPALDASDGGNARMTVKFQPESSP